MLSLVACNKFIFVDMLGILVLLNLEYFLALNLQKKNQYMYINFSSR